MTNTRSRITELTVGRSPILSATGVADRLGAFDEEFASDGIAVRTVTTSAPSSLDTTVTEAGSLEALHARANGGATRLVALGWARQPRDDIRPYVITAGRDVIEQAPELVTRFLAVLLETAQWAAGHRRELARIVRSQDVHQFPAGVQRGAHRRLGIDLARHRVAALAAQQAHLHVHGFLDREVDLVDWIDPAPLRAARDLIAARRPVAPAPERMLPAAWWFSAGFASPA
jgi:hypothetical protein